MTLGHGDELARSHSEPLCEAVKVRKRDVSLPALNAADVVAVQARAARELLLRFPELTATAPHCVSKRGVGRGQHARRLSPRTIKVYTL